MPAMMYGKRQRRGVGQAAAGFLSREVEISGGCIGGGAEEDGDGHSGGERGKCYLNGTRETVQRVHDEIHAGAGGALSDGNRIL
jgi:hypothetical protein